MMESAVLYFDKPGKGNTASALAAGARRAKELSLSHLVVASASGETALALHAEAKRQGWAGALVCVTHHVGFTGPGEDEMGGKMRERLCGLGFTLVTGTHALSGPERSFRLKFKGISPLEIIAETLRLFGQGVKVCAEIAVMACDAGAVTAGQDALFFGGTGEGADAACVITPAGQSAFLDLRIREIVCKPR
jgi:hypothetical protein